MKKENQFYGFYSTKQRQMFDRQCVVVWSTPNGKEVNCTKVAQDPNYKNGLDDLICVGPVVRYLRSLLGGKSHVSLEKQILETPTPIIIVL